MSAYERPGIVFDERAFDPMKIMTVRHALMEHPLLQIPSLLALGKRLGETGAVRFHNDQATAGTNFMTAPETHHVALSVEEMIGRLAQAKVWLALHNIQKDPLYRTLVDEVLDYVKPAVSKKDPGMCHRGGWIFLTSPNAVTPYHMDHEHNFILQIRGKKTLHVWEPLDRSIVTERALELFHAKMSRDLVVYRDDFAPKARVFNLEPGMGGYMPTTAPHWVKNGDNVSITVSFTYYTDETRRRKVLHRGNHALRALGVHPHPVGESSLRDEVKRAAFCARERLGPIVRRRAFVREDTPYAIA